MESLGFKPELSVLLLATSLLLLLLGQSVAVAPGDEDVRCPVPEYPVKVKVLMDSWRYHTLIAENDGNGVWTAFTIGQRRRMTPMEPIMWSSQGICEGGSVSVCSGGHMEGKWLKTQSINKTLPSPNTYPVRIYVNITYSFMSCPRRECDDNFELLLANYSSNGTSYQYGEGGIMPDNSIQNTSGISSDTKQFFFDSETSFAGIFLALRSVEACVTVSRVLVYRYECPGHDRLPTTDLLRRPATQAPSSLMPVTPYCAENSHLVNKTSTILCRSDGVWVNGKARCECDSGYTEDQEGTTCKALPSQSTTGYIAQQTASPSTTSSLPTNGATRKTTVVGEIVTSVSREQTSSLSPSPTASHPPIKDTTSGRPITLSTTPSLPTAGTTEERTVDARARDSGSGLPIPIVAGVGALVVVILALILVVVLVLVIVRNHKKSKQNENHFSGDGKQLTNPVYDAVSQNIPVKLPASNGNGTSGHKQDDQTLHNFSNSLYNTTQHSILTNGVSESHTTQNGNTFDGPQYSVPNGNRFVQSEYEVPVTTPTSSEGPTPPPPHVYDYATVPTGMAPEYATLEPPAHAYHTLEFPSGTNGAVLPAAVSAGREGGGGETDGHLEGEQEYSVIGEK